MGDFSDCIGLFPGLLITPAPDLPDDLLLGPARDDTLRALQGRSRVTSRRPTWLLLDDLEHGFAEGGHGDSEERE
jgi:hypothetical protein